MMNAGVCTVHDWRHTGLRYGAMYQQRCSTCDTLRSVFDPPVPPKWGRQSEAWDALLKLLET